MYNDILLPDDEAWASVTADLRQTKESRNALSKENSYVIFNQLVCAEYDNFFRQLKRHISEIELERDEYVLWLVFMVFFC